jgi:3-methyl-2-oxobutanoate hydroxymethyltransferase
MVVRGLPTTVGVTLDMMVLHGCAVMRRSSRALVVADLTFASYEGSPQQAMHRRSASCARRAATPSSSRPPAVVAETIAFLVRRGVLCVPKLPTSTMASKPRAAPPRRGKTCSPMRARSIRPARSRWSEGGSGELAEEITRSIPTVGIGASLGCGGQILVTDDMIDTFDWTPECAATTRCATSLPKRSKLMRPRCQAARLRCPPKRTALPRHQRRSGHERKYPPA